MNETLVAIGATLQPHGLKGELKVFVEEESEDDLFQAEAVFLTIAGKKIPYFIENIRGGNALIVKFEDVDNLEAAQKIAKKTIEIRVGDRIPDALRVKPPVAEYKHLEGYEVHDKYLGKIGKISEVIEMPHQEMAIVFYNSKERLIPLNEQLIVAVDEKKQTLLLDLPEGILDI